MFASNISARMTHPPLNLHLAADGFYDDLPRIPSNPPLLARRPTGVRRQRAAAGGGGSAGPTGRAGPGSRSEMYRSKGLVTGEPTRGRWGGGRWGWLIVHLFIVPFFVSRVISAQTIADSSIQVDRCPHYEFLKLYIPREGIASDLFCCAGGGDVLA